MKTEMRIDVGRYFATLQKTGDVFCELVKNAIEAEGCTEVRIMLNRDNNTLEVRNNGSPIGDLEDVDKYLLTLFLTGKSDTLNWGKGFSSVLQEKSTIVKTGRIVVAILAWNDVTIEEMPQEKIDGMVVLLSLGDCSEVLSKTDDEHENFLSGFITGKTVYFNDRKIITVPKPDVDTISKGIEVGKFPRDKSWFALADGSYCPITIGNLKCHCTVIISDIRHMDTERSRLTWNAESAINHWYKENVLDELVGNVDQMIMKIWYRDFCEWMLKMASAAGISLQIKDEEVTPELVSFAIRWQESGNTFCKQFKVPQFINDIPIEDKETLAEVKKTKMDIYNACAEFPEHFGITAEEAFADVNIGVLIERGQAQGKAIVSDLCSVCYRVSNVSWDDTWSMREDVDAYIAYYIDPDIFVRCQTVQFTTEKKDSVSIVPKVPTAAKLIGTPKMRATTMQEMERFIDAMKEMAEKLPAQEKTKTEARWSTGIEAGITMLIHVNAKPEDRNNPEKMRVKYTNWCSVIKLVLDYTKNLFTDCCIPVMLIGNTNSMSMRLGPYVGLSRKHTKLPDTKRRAGLFLLQLALHELAHFRYIGHDRDFAMLVEDTYLGLLRNETFLTDLERVIIE